MSKRSIFAFLPFFMALAACGNSKPHSGRGMDASIDETDAATDDAANEFPLADAGEDATPCTGAPYPIVLHHGFFGFQNVGALTYFFNVADHLRGNGNVVFESAVDPFNNSLVRAAELGTEIDSLLATTNACKVVIVAHSQGGVDARALVSRLGYASKVAAIVTVATPHRGTTVAALANGADPGWLSGVDNFFAGLANQVLSPGHTQTDLKGAFIALSPVAMTEFNNETTDDPSVPIYSIAGRSDLAIDHGECDDGEWSNSSRGDVLNPLLAVSGTYLRGRLFGEGTVNDGLVDVSSAKWGHFLGCIPADHFDEIGQIAELTPQLVSGFDHIAFYDQVVAYVRSKGF